MRRLTAAFFAVALLLVPATSHADDPRKEQAAPFFEQGRKLAEKGQNADSLEQFKKAFAIYPSPNTQFNIARQEQLVGKRVAALRDYRGAVANPILLPQFGELARRYIAELEGSLGHVKVVGREGTKITVAGEEHTLPLADPLDVEPGNVTIAASVDGRAITKSAAVSPGQTITVSLDGASEPAGAHASATGAAGTSGAAGASGSEPFTPPPDAPPSEGFWTTRHTIGVALAGLAVAGAGVGVGFLFAREGHVSDENDIASSNPLACSDPASAPCRDFKSAQDGASTAQTLSIVSFVVAGALAVGSVILFWPSGQSTATATSRVLANGRGGSFVTTF
jgi:hypothetical protein